MWSQKDIRKAKALVKKGYSKSKIAKAFKISKAKTIELLDAYDIVSKGERVFKRKKSRSDIMKEYHRKIRDIVRLSGFSYKDARKYYSQGKKWSLKSHFLFVKGKGVKSQLCCLIKYKDAKTGEITPPIETFSYVVDKDPANWTNEDYEIAVEECIAFGQAKAGGSNFYPIDIQEKEFIYYIGKENA